MTIRYNRFGMPYCDHFPSISLMCQLIFRNWLRNWNFNTRKYPWNIKHITMVENCIRCFGNMNSIVIIKISSGEMYVLWKISWVEVVFFHFFVKSKTQKSMWSILAHSKYWELENHLQNYFLKKYYYTYYYQEVAMLWKILNLTF